MDQTATGPDRIAAELAADLDAGFAAIFEAHQNVLFSTALRICPSCRNARRITAAHRHGFASLAAAGGAGFRPCLHCLPV